MQFSTILPSIRAIIAFFSFVSICETSCRPCSYRLCEFASDYEDEEVPTPTPYYYNYNYNDSYNYNYNYNYSYNYAVPNNGDYRREVEPSDGQREQTKEATRNIFQPIPDPNFKSPLEASEAENAEIKQVKRFRYPLKRAKLGQKKRIPTRSKIMRILQRALRQRKE